SPMLVMYGTLHTPFSPGMRPRLTVPSGRRGVGCGGPDMPRPRPPPEGVGCAPGCWAPTAKNAVKRTATSELSTAPRRSVRTTPLLGRRSMSRPERSAARRVGLARRRKQPPAGRHEGDRSRVADIRAILGLRALDHHFVADVQRVARPSLTHQAVRAA